MARRPTYVVIVGEGTIWVMICDPPPQRRTISVADPPVVRPAARGEGWSARSELTRRPS
jgi:hypothetical protein